jgi:PAS domain S-box-containing protein
MTNNIKITAVSEDTLRSQDTILIIEDDEGLNQLISKRLNQAGFSTDSAFTGEEAISKAETGQNIILLLDYQLPDMTGKELLESLDKARKLLPFVIMTGYGDEEIAVDMMKRGAIDYIVKTGKFINILPQKIKRAYSEIEYKRRLEESQEALRASEALHRTIMDTSPDEIIVTDLVGRVMKISRKTLEMHGFDRKEEIIGKNILDLISSEHHLKVMDNMRSVLEQGSIRNVEYTFLKEDGTSFIGELSASILLNKEKKPIAFIQVIRDVTERKKFEERLKILFEFAPDPYYLIDLDGTFIDGNQQAEKLVDDKRENFIGENMIEAWILNDEDKAKALKALAKNRRGLSTEREEYTLHRKDGSQIIVEISTHPVTIGTESLVLGIARDITETKKMQEELDNYRKYLEDQIKERTEKLNKALSDSENNLDRIDTILKSVSDGLIVTDINHHIIMMNSLAEDWLGIRFSEVYDQTIDRAFKQTELKELIRQAMSEQSRPVRSDIRIENKKNKYLGVLTTLRDVTQERKID